jgi:ribosomal protein S10
MKPLAQLNFKSTKIEDLEAYLNQLKLICEKTGCKFRGAASQATKVLKVHVRRSTSGEGSGTIDYYKLRIWSKCIFLYSERVFEKIMSLPVPASTTIKWTLL